jgi:hypothetical protein
MTRSFTTGKTTTSINLMKTAYYLLFAFLVSSSVHAGIKVPAGVYRMAQLDQAMDEAGKQRKPLFLVYSDDTRNISVNNPELLEDTLKAGADWAVTVFISLEEEILMPPTILSSAKGGYLPMAFIATPETDKIFKTILPPANPIEPKDLKKHVRAEINASKGEIAAWFTAKPAHAPELPGDRKLRWSDLTAKSMPDGVFDRVSNDRLFFRGISDTPHNEILLTNLNPATRRYFRYITGGTTQSKAVETPAPALKTWTNTRGKTLEATLVSLKNGQLTLRTTAGKEYVLGIETLSSESQEQARRLTTEESQKK